MHTFNKFDEAEFEQLSNRFNPDAYIIEKTVKLTNNSFFDKMRNSIAFDRRGEVVFCVLRPNGKAIIVTCEEYPEGIFRIPTGGINYGEDIIKAVERETREELGLQTKIIKFCGVIQTRLECDEDYVMFYSYLFIMSEIGGKLLEDATDDEISEIREVKIEQLQSVAQQLASIEGKWHDWGMFRYETTQAIAEYLVEKAKWNF